MFNKIFEFLGFNSNDNIVGLCQLSDNTEKVQQATVKPAKKELKLSDLMRGN